MIPGFPKIHALGTKETQGIFNGEVEITEKIDGSAIAFGMINGELIIRSKSQQLNIDNPDKMFAKGVEYIKSIKHKLIENFKYYGEYMRGNKHNVLVYGREPQNNIMLYGLVYKGITIQYEGISAYAHGIGLEPVPLLFKGDTCLYNINDDKWLSRISALGNCQIEGIVVKNYHTKQIGKYVSEKFKEVSGARRKHVQHPDRFEEYKQRFCTEARWAKAVQHLRDSGNLGGSTKDIGPLLKEINQDIEAEEKENIKEWLWNEYGKRILRDSGKGFVEWYKGQLLNQLNEEDRVIDLGGC